MKRIAALLLSLALLFSLAACGQSETVPAGTQAPAASPERRIELLLPLFLY